MALGERASLTGVIGVEKDLFFHDVILQVGSFRPMKVRAGFADLSGKAYGVVGQRGFFDQFDVTLRLKSEEIEILRPR